MDGVWVSEDDYNYISSKFPDSFVEDYRGLNGVHSHSTIAAMMYDSAILLGLAACKSAHSHVNGKDHFGFILNTTFEGASGNIAIDSETGTRSLATSNFALLNMVPVATNDTNVMFQSVDVAHFNMGKWTRQNEIIFNSGTNNIPVDVPPPKANFNYIGTSLRSVGYSLATVILLSSLSLIVWTMRNQGSRVVRASQPFFLYCVCAGT